MLLVGQFSFYPMLGFISLIANLAIGNIISIDRNVAFSFLNNFHNTIKWIF